MFVRRRREEEMRTAILLKLFRVSCVRARATLLFRLNFLWVISGHIFYLVRDPLQYSTWYTDI